MLNKMILPTERMDIQKPEIICHLDELMQQRGLTQQQLSEDTGIAPAGIRAYQEYGAGKPCTSGRGCVLRLHSHFLLSFMPEYVNLKSRMVIGHVKSI